MYQIKPVVLQANETEKFTQFLKLVTGHLADQDLAERIVIAASEQWSNIQRHQYGDIHRTSKPVFLNAEITWQQVVIVFVDTGKPWTKDGYFHDPYANQTLRRLANEGALNGRGLPLTYLNCDSLQFRNGGCVRILAFLLKREESAA